LILNYISYATGGHPLSLKTLTEFNFNENRKMSGVLNEIAKSMSTEKIEFELFKRIICGYIHINGLEFYNCVNTICNNVNYNDLIDSNSITYSNEEKIVYTFIRNIMYHHENKYDTNSVFLEVSSCIMHVARSTLARIIIIAIALGY
jgi:hypothetical protein